MKFSKLSQLFLVSSIGLLVATLLTACQIVTIDYVFVASSKGATAGSAGQINIFAVDSESGAMRLGAATVSSGGTSPVALAVTSDYANLYVANQGNNSVVHFAIAANGVLTQKDVVTTSFTPSSLAVNAAGTYLFVVGGTSQGKVAVYPLSSGAIGTLASLTPLVVPGYSSDSILPTGVTVLANGNAVFVSSYDLSAYNPGGTTSSTANPGWVFGYTIGSGGVLNATSGSPWKAGVKPSGLAADPTNRFVYVTDFASNQLIGYKILDGNVLNFLSNGPFKTGNEPTAVVVDPRGKYIYVSNALDSSVSAYAIDLTTGTPSTAVNATGSSTNSTDTQPVAIMVDPALGRFVYTANVLGNSASGFRLNPDSGAMTQTQSTPYPTGSKPSAIVGVPHGNHSVQSVTP
jgi:6-phosphogluconolactonase (cycloisomerase 2 family)